MKWTQMSEASNTPSTIFTKQLLSSKPKTLCTRPTFGTTISHLHFLSSTDIFTTQRAFRFLNPTHSFRINGKLQKRSPLEAWSPKLGPKWCFFSGVLRFIFVQFTFAADAKRISGIFRSRHLFFISGYVSGCFRNVRYLF